MRFLRPVSAVGFLALLASPLLAQERYATVDVRAGYTMLGGAAGDSLKGQSSFGASAYIALGNRLHLGLSADWAHHSRKTSTGAVVGGPNDPQWNVLHTFLKVSYDVVQTEKVTFALNAGPGFAVFSPNEVLKEDGLTSDAHFGVNAGARLTYWFSDRVGIILSPQVNFIMKKTSGQIFLDNSTMFLPLTGGFAFKI